MKQPWHHKISQGAQLGGIETAVIDNGAARGTRIAWINTGTGLRYKVVIDRAMDIADAFYNQYSLAWLSHVGITSPQPFSSHGMDWIKTFGGGLLTTCGLSHVGGPETDEYGERGLHGGISNLPAEIESVIQPDPLHGNLEMSITGRIRQTQVFGPSLELKRTISGVLGQPVIRIRDEVFNAGNTAQPHMLLYHFNFGWPLVDEGTSLLWKGNWYSGSADKPGKIFREGNDFRTAPAPLESHNGTGEEVAVIDPPVINGDGQCCCGLHNANLRLAVSLTFRKDQLPWLTNWQHWGQGEYVTGLEPGTHPPIGQARARKDNQLIFLPPGSKQTYELELEVLHTENAISELIKKTKS
ncbi:MAG TPA: aldose 1-epimerase family protein [Chryseolinea sp.]|nr:aldose 1-epimerase family protein [Chryseolinea sp.]